jgi:CRP-like cAMP-binding protein
VAFFDVRGRLAYQLLRLAREFGQPDPGGIRIPFRMSQVTLAGMVASSRESVNRALGGFATAGVVAQRGGFFVVSDLASLEAVVTAPQ